MLLRGLHVLTVFGLWFNFIYADNNNFLGERDVFFLLRVRDRSFNNEEAFTLQNTQTVAQSAFDASKPTAFIVHGYLEDRNVPHYLLLSKTLLEAEDQNIFFVDWSRGGKDFIYERAQGRVGIAAEAVGNFVKVLHDNFNLNYQSTTLIGMSLGAHVVGLAGKRVLSGQLRKIVGLDPAGPRFDVNEPESRLTADSAQFTECLHTGFPLGIKEPICQVDIYFNSGAKQPGCFVFGWSSSLCSHVKVVEYFTETVSNPKAFDASRCSDLNSALNMNCNIQPGIFVNDPENDLKKPKGIFHVTTKQ